MSEAFKQKTKESFLIRYKRNNVIPSFLQQIFDVFKNNMGGGAFKKVF